MIIITFLLSVLALLSLYIIIRNNKVCEFTVNLNDEGFEVCKSHLLSVTEYNKKERDEHERLHKIWQSINNISYNKILYSFKPLKKEYWLTKEQIDFLNLKF